MSFNAAGTKAALIAPAGKIINPDTVELGRAYLESLGYQIIPGKLHAGKTMARSH